MFQRVQVRALCLICTLLSPMAIAAEPPSTDSVKAISEGSALMEASTTLDGLALSVWGVALDGDVSKASLRLEPSIRSGEWVVALEHENTLTGILTELEHVAGFHDLGYWVHTLTETPAPEGLEIIVERTIVGVLHGDSGPVTVGGDVLHITTADGESAHHFIPLVQGNDVAQLSESLLFYREASQRMAQRRLDLESMLASSAASTKAITHFKHEPGCPNDGPIDLAQCLLRCADQALSSVARCDFIAGTCHTGVAIGVSLCIAGCPATGPGAGPCIAACLGAGATGATLCVTSHESCISSAELAALGCVHSC